MRRGAALLLAALALGAAAPTPPPAWPVPSEDGFTSRMANRFRAALPGYEVTITEPLSLAIRRPGGAGEPFQVNVDRIFNICRNESAEICEEESANFVRVFQTHLTSETAPATPAQLRVAVRQRAYCAELDRIGAGHSAAQRILARPLPPDLCEVLMVDYPDRMRGLNGGDLPQLSLSEADAWALGARQALANLPALPSLRDFGQGGFVAITDHEYIPTLLLARDGWRALAAAQGPLLVAVPADEVMIIARASQVDVARLRELVGELYRMGRRPISDSIYRWTDTGWETLE